MNSPDETNESSRSAETKLGWLIVARLLTALLLFIISVLWNRAGDPPQTNSRSIKLLMVVAAFTIVYAIIFRISRNIGLQARFQLTVDILIVTWLVWHSGVIQSPYIALYIVIIATSSLFFVARDAVATSVACAVAFTACALLLTGIGTTHGPSLIDRSLQQTIQAVGMFDVAFFVVGLLSARLAERQSRSDVRLLAATQSLADLRALHERIVESIRSGVVTTDLEGKIYTFNQAAVEITGYEEKTVRGKDASVLFGDLKNRIRDTLKAKDTDEGSPRFETDCLTPEGLRVRLGYSISPLFSERNETTGMVITFQDLTQVRTLEETSRRQDRLAAIGRMAASIAHEIRNPLAAMRGSIQMLRSEMDSDSHQTELMEIILRESDRLNRIITDFLTYARPRSLVQSRVDVRDMLHQTFALLRHSPEILENQKVVEELPDEPLMADADEGQLRQVFWNLSRNALQAMPQGGTLRARLEKNSHDRLRISFSDSGRGMTPDQVEHLFEPFSSTTGGTGLGLSIVYQIIRDHGGTINVRSREGQGTTITIELPAATANEIQGSSKTGQTNVN
jgi:two-component system sensor histidine kinase PilS (NtrC family)